MTWFIDILYDLMICRHLLIAFGGLAGLEECIEEDTNLKVCLNLLQLIEIDIYSIF